MDQIIPRHIITTTILIDQIAKKMNFVGPTIQLGNSIIAQQEGGLATLTTRGGVRLGPGGPILTLTRLFFSIPKLVPFKKLNEAGQNKLVGIGK